MPFTIGYPELTMDPFEPVRDMANFNEKFGLSDPKKNPDPDSPAYFHTTKFFDGVVDALRALAGHLKIEIIQGELMHELSKMRFHGDESRPVEFPRLFTRAWLSNVPFVFFRFHTISLE